MEATLRQREDQIRQLEREVADANEKLQTQDRQLAVLRSRGQANRRSELTRAGGAVAGSVPEEVELAWGSVQALSIHALTSGIVHETGQPSRLSPKCFV